MHAYVAASTEYLCLRYLFGFCLGFGFFRKFLFGLFVRITLILWVISVFCFGGFICGCCVFCVCQLCVVSGVCVYIYIYGVCGVCACTCMFPCFIVRDTLSFLGILMCVDICIYIILYVLFKLCLVQKC